MNQGLPVCHPRVAPAKGPASSLPGFFARQRQHPHPALSCNQAGEGQKKTRENDRRATH